MLVNTGGQFYSGGDSIVPVHYCLPAALYRYNTAPRQESGEAVLYRYTGPLAIFPEYLLQLIAWAVRNIIKIFLYHCHGCVNAIQTI